MAGKRKRKRSGHGFEGDQKRQKSGFLDGGDAVVKEAVLAKFYPQVLSLREYLLTKLPKASKVRKKKILSVGHRQDEGEQDRNLSRFLDQTLIGVSKWKDTAPCERWQQWATFSQRGDDSISIANSSGSTVFSQSEVVDFTIWLLFSKSQGLVGKSQHLLCQGYSRDVSARAAHQGENIASAIPGVRSVYPNSHVTSMKAWPWPQVLGLMGKEGEKSMVDLILDCGIFLLVENSRGIYSQLSGKPLGDLQILSGFIEQGPQLSKMPPQRSPRKPSEINFVRTRMMHGRAVLNARGGVRFGLRQIHVFNQFPLVTSKVSPPKADVLSDKISAQPSTVRVMMYIFPRQFDIHNVFMHAIDPQQTVQPFKDYTCREDEIKLKYPSSEAIKIPKRLRGMLPRLVQRIQKRHERCAYKLLLEYYCPINNQESKTVISSPRASILPSAEIKAPIPTCSHDPTVSVIPSTATPPTKSSMMSHAIPTATVSAFCRAVFSHLIPSEFWGSGDTQTHNERIFHLNIDRFINLGRVESLSLHEVSQGLRVADLEWLCPPNLIHIKASKSDMQKRWEIFNEFLYYLFDSILIPLVKSNFYVTESNIHRNRLFYFRHDVWRSIAEPTLASLKLTMFEEVKLKTAQRLLGSRTLGFSHVRLLPKETGVRPIINLSRRTMKKGYKGCLGVSINTVLAPVFHALTFESLMSPERLASTMFSVGDLYPRLKAFKSTLLEPSTLYFAKADVKSAFDTIPQSAVLRLISSLPSEEEYAISKHAEIMPGDNYRSDPSAKPRRKWKTLARSPNDFGTFEENLYQLSSGSKNAVFVENVVSQFRDKDDILDLLIEHVRRNIVKIGKKFYRQKEGIPQGSVVSSLLCNYFYADLELNHLSFLRNGESLLLRLIDDFLLITTNKEHAKQFLQIMHDGLPAYGVRVNPDKTLVNFEAIINGKKVSSHAGSSEFPYCGSFINMKTLDISKDRERRKDLTVIDSLTVGFPKEPGKVFQRRILSTFKIQAHPMFLDTSFNSLYTVLTNIHSAFIESSTKMYYYIHCLPTSKQPGAGLVIRTISALVDLAFGLIKSKSRSSKNEGYECRLSKAQVEWLAMDAFLTVLKKRQSKFRPVIGWLESRVGSLRGKERVLCERLENIFAPKRRRA